MHSFSRTPECRKNFYKGHCPPTLHLPYILIGQLFYALPPSHSPDIHLYICLIVHLPLPVLLVIFSPLRYSCAASCVENKQSDRPDIRRMTEKKIAGLSKFFDGYAAEDHRPDCGFSLPSLLQPPLPSLQTASPYSIFSVTIRYVA